MDLGNTIRTIRNRKGFTQIEFANKCNITQSYLSQIESNKKEPNISTVKIISKNLDIPLPVIFFLSMNESDIDETKVESFKVINKSVKNLITDILLTP